MARTGDNKVISKFIYNVFVLLFIAVSASDALRCFECNSHNDSRCADTVPPDSMKVTCNDKYTFCRKIDQQVEFKVHGMAEDRRIVRSCGWDESKYKNECYDRSGFGGIQRVCSCYGDNCNGSDKRSPTSFYMIILSFASIFLSTKTITSSLLN